MQPLRSTIRLSQHRSCGWLAIMCVAIAATLPTASIAAPNGPPELNVGPSCEAAARVAIVAGRDKEACLGDERAARDQLTKNWSQYATADKTLCVGMNRTGGSSSYVELVSCLEVMRDATSIGKDQVLSEPLLDNGALNTRSLLPTDLNEATPYAGSAKKGASHKRNHRK
jgi:hypothetical protein